MSRYIIPSLNSKYEVIVGWDAPLCTFFVQVHDLELRETDEDDSIVVWKGCSYREINDLEIVKDLILPYARLPVDVKKQLIVDSD